NHARICISATERCEIESYYRYELKNIITHTCISLNSSLFVCIVLYTLSAVHICYFILSKQLVPPMVVYCICCFPAVHNSLMDEPVFQTCYWPLMAWRGEVICVEDTVQL